MDTRKSKIECSWICGPRVLPFKYFIPWGRKRDDSWSMALKVHGNIYKRIRTCPILLSSRKHFFVASSTSLRLSLSLPHILLREFLSLARFLCVTLAASTVWKPHKRRPRDLRSLPTFTLHRLLHTFLDSEKKRQGQRLSVLFSVLFISKKSLWLLAAFQFECCIIAACLAFSQETELGF